MRWDDLHARVSSIHTAVAEVEAHFGGLHAGVLHHATGLFQPLGRCVIVVGVAGEHPGADAVIALQRGGNGHLLSELVQLAALVLVNAMRFRCVHSAFEGMQQELNSERTQTQQRWSRREKQIQQATFTLIGVAGDIQGLAQQDLPALELVGDEAGS
jgi:hypothetical protein